MATARASLKPKTAEPTQQHSAPLFIFGIKRLLYGGIAIHASDLEEAKKKLMDSLVTEIMVLTDNGHKTIMRKRKTPQEQEEMEMRKHPEYMAARQALWAALEQLEYREYISEYKAGGAEAAMNEATT
jgi:hypothetical protein